MQASRVGDPLTHSHLEIWGWPQIRGDQDSTSLTENDPHQNRPSRSSFRQTQRDYRSKSGVRGNEQLSNQVLHANSQVRPVRIGHRLLHSGPRRVLTLESSAGASGGVSVRTRARGAMSRQVVTGFDSHWDPLVMVLSNPLTKLKNGRSVPLSRGCRRMRESDV
jgi:hypothetical protein